MSESGGVARPNPFSPVAIARTGMTDAVPVTVDTPAIDDAVRSLAGYLRPRPDDRTGDGKILAIVGDYGTGKTHLAMHLLRHAEREQRDAEPDHAGRIVVHQMYLEASPKGFRKIYQEFVSRVKRDELMETLRDYYADIVADTLDGSEFTRDTARQVRSGVFDPGSVVDSLGLVESRLTGRLRAELIRVTRADAFGIAMTLLLSREEFADEVWSWLTGEPPTPALIARGVDLQIASEEIAVAALGVFAHLYNRREHRFVLVIDELERILSESEGQGRSAVAGFKRLFEVFGAAGGFLVVVGLPDLFDLLGQSERERVHHEITMRVFDADRVRQLIEFTHLREFDTARLAPFTSEAPERIARLTDGTARQVIRLCHRAYQIALDQNFDTITDDMIVAAARHPEAFPRIERIRDDIRRELTRQGLLFEQNRWLPGIQQSVDFWISRGAEEAGCAILVAEAVVSETEAEQLDRLAREIGSQFTASRILLVIVGYYDSGLRERLRGFDREPIECRRHGFDENLLGAVTSALKQIDHFRGTDDLGRLRERVEQIHWQQNSARDSVDRLAQRVGELGRVITQLPESVRREVRVGVADAAALGEQPPARRLPQPVELVFADAFQELTRFTAIESEIWTALTSPADFDLQRRSLQATMGVEELYPAVGAAGLLRTLVEAFRSAVAELHDEYGRADPETDSAVAEERLTELCIRYEDIQFHMRLSRLDDFPVAEGARFGEHELEQGWYAARQEFRSRFRELGRRVREASLPLLTGQVSD